MSIRGFGFIDEKGRLLSLPQLYTDNPEDGHIPISGTEGNFDRRGALLEYGPIVLRDKQIGAYAITAGQAFHRIGFHNDVRWFLRLWLRLKIALNHHHQ